MDLDPNYDPSDFLKISSNSKDVQSAQGRFNEPTSEYSIQTPDYAINVNIKQEPKSQQQQSSQDQSTYDLSSFNMSEMLIYKKESEQSDSRLEMGGETSGTQSQSTAPPENIAAIHDDLAISDSDEDDAETSGPKKEPSDNDNDDDGDGLWF